MKRIFCLLALAVSTVFAQSSVQSADGTAAARAPSAPSAVWPIVVGDGIPAPLAGPGDAVRGRAAAFDRESACTLCHQLATGDPNAPLAAGGDLAPPLIGVGARQSAAQLRLRLVDSSRINPKTIMPAYFRLSDLRQVATAYSGRTILDAQRIEDLIAWLQTLK